MSKYKIVMQCSEPVMDADGVQVHAPGDLLPEGHPDTENRFWGPTIVKVESDGEILEPLDPHPESTVRPTPASVAEVVNPSVVSPSV